MLDSKDFCWKLYIVLVLLSNRKKFKHFLQLLKQSKIIFQALANHWVLQFFQQIKNNNNLNKNNLMKKPLSKHSCHHFNSINNSSNNSNNNNSKNCKNNHSNNKKNSSNSHNKNNHKIKWKSFHQLLKLNKHLNHQFHK